MQYCFWGVYENEMTDPPLFMCTCSRSSFQYTSLWLCAPLNSHINRAACSHVRWANCPWGHNQMSRRRALSSPNPVPPTPDFRGFLDAHSASHTDSRSSCRYSVEAGRQWHAPLGARDPRVHALIGARIDCSRSVEATQPLRQSPTARTIYWMTCVRNSMHCTRQRNQCTGSVDALCYNIC